MDTLWLFKRKYNINQLHDPNYFRTFISDSYLKNNSFEKTKHWQENFLFAKFVSSLIPKIWKQIQFKKNKKFDETLQAEKSFIKPNKILVGDKEINIPKTVQGPPFIGLPESDVLANIKKEDLDYSIYIFEQSLRLISTLFKESKIRVVYIPAPLSIYQIVSPSVTYDHWTVNLETFEKPYFSVKSSLIKSQSYFLCKKLESAVRKFGFEFLDAKQSLKNTAINHLIHGPKDWAHFNKKGYEALLNGIMEAFFVKNDHKEKFGCRE